jgi:hypothetical protein
VRSPDQLFRSDVFRRNGVALREPMIRRHQHDERFVDQPGEYDARRVPFVPEKRKIDLSAR